MMNTKRNIILGTALILGLLSFIIYPSTYPADKPEHRQGNRIEEEIKIETVRITQEEAALIEEKRTDPEPETVETVKTYVDTVDNSVDKWTDTGYSYTSDEIWEMTRIVYLENGITWPECTYETVYLTACVILNRLYDWPECTDIYSVIREPGQYSTADRYHDYDGSALGSSNSEGWDISSAAVWDAIENLDRAPHFQSRSIQGAVYYTDPYTGEIFCY